MYCPSMPSYILFPCYRQSKIYYFYVQLLVEYKYIFQFQVAVDYLIAVSKLNCR